MKNDLLIGGFTILFTVIVVGLAAFVGPRAKPPLPKINCKILNADSEFFKDQEIQLTTGGMEYGPEAHLLVYRARTDLPFCVICHFKEKVNGRIPPVITGTCLGRTGEGPVVVVDCR